MKSLALLLAVLVLSLSFTACATTTSAKKDGCCGHCEKPKKH